MNHKMVKNGCLSILFLAMLLPLPVTTWAVVDGITGTTFNLTAKAGTIYMGDGGVAYMWGYASGSGLMQYPGPTLILNQGDTITVNLANQLPVPVSIVFPGQNVNATAPAGVGQPGLLSLEARPGETISYSFIASQPGTYMYYSGTRPELQVEMGLIGAIVIRPTLGVDCALPPDPNNIRPSRGYVYCAPNAYFDREYLFLTSEIDPLIHRQVELGNMAQADNTIRRPTAWFLNGRNFSDTMAEAFISYLPNQPYNAMPLMHPGERVLIRLIGGGRNLHPFHTHGQNHLVIARDGKLLKTAVSTIVDLPVSDFTTTAVPGETVDAIWGPWTGEKLGWDVYGHVGGELYPAGCPGVPAGVAICAGYVPGNPATYFDPYNNEYCPDHGKPIPVQIPAPSLLAFGPMYGGTPYLGVPGELPPSHVQQNPQAGLSFMWHSHNERELTTNNIFIGGMATMSLVLPYLVIDNNVCTPVNIP
jgi:hypothetical protein